MLWLVQADAQYLKPFRMILIVSRDDVRQFRSARPAPRGPKIQQHYLPFVIIRKIDGFSVHGHGMKTRSLLPRGNSRSWRGRIARQRDKTDKSTRPQDALQTK